MAIKKTEENFEDLIKTRIKIEIKNWDTHTKLSINLYSMRLKKIKIFPDIFSFFLSQFAFSIQRKMYRYKIPRDIYFTFFIILSAIIYYWGIKEICRIPFLENIAARKLRIWKLPYGICVLFLLYWLVLHLYVLCIYQPLRYF